MVSQTVAKILAAEQSAVQSVSQAEAQAARIIETARQEALRYLDEEAKKTAAAAEAIAAQMRAKIEQDNIKAEQAALTKAETINADAMRKLPTAQALVVSMIIPE